MSNKIKVIGAGGIGGCVLPVLCRYVNYAQDKFPNPEVSVIDGDSYEEKNRDRQSFSEFGPKATQTVNELRDKFGRITFWDHPVFVDEVNIVRHVRNGDIVLSCVDNHATRKILFERASELDNITIINGGNHTYPRLDGDVYVYIRRDGVDLTPNMLVTDVKVRNPTDLHPSQTNQPGSCSRQAAENPQVLIVNNIVAANMLSAFYNITDPTVYSESVVPNAVNHCHIYSDVRTLKTNPSPRWVNPPKLA